MAFFKKYSLRILMVITLLVAVGITQKSVSQWFMHNSGPRLPSALSKAILPTAKVLRPFNLLDHNQQPFRLKNLKGQWTFLFFGYTHCPDICPVAMGMLAELFQRLEAESPFALQKARGVFISVDPQRDTAEHLKNYTSYFHPEFLGVTGSEKQLKAFSKQVGALYFRSSDFAKPAASDPVSNPASDPVSAGAGVEGEQTPKDKDENYQVSHSSAFYLLDPLGRLVAIFPKHYKTEAILKGYVEIRKYADNRHFYQSGTHRATPRLMEQVSLLTTLDHALPH